MIFHNFGFFSSSLTGLVGHPRSKVKESCGALKRGVRSVVGTKPAWLVDPFGMDRVVVKPHKAADLIEQPGGWGWTFHGIALVFWGSDSSKTISRTLDNGPGLLT